MSYDEEAEATRYIWRYCTHIMTDFERRAGRAAMGREKVAAMENAHQTTARKLSERWGLVGDPEIDSALSAGTEAFRRSVCLRILSEWGDQIINRCPRCRRIVRTPQASQCFWCGHDWHGNTR
jgi:hypothetical protein